MNDKTHYRKVFKSDHLGVADLEDMIEARNPLVFTIKQVRQEYGVAVAGKKGNFNIAYFEEDIKPWVLNAGNCLIMKKFAGSPNVQDWSNTRVQLYIEPKAKYKGEIVGGVRINPTQPQINKPELMPDTTAWDNAIAAYKRDGNLHKVTERMSVSTENAAKIMELPNVS